MIAIVTLQFYDGDSTEAKFLVRHCGYKTPPPVTSSGNTLLIKFKSDGDITGKGFVATVTLSKPGELEESKYRGIPE